MKQLFERVSSYWVRYDKYEIRTMKCRACNKEFVINWIDGMPFPLANGTRWTIFLSEFIQGI